MSETQEDEKERKKKEDSLKFDEEIKYTQMISELNKKNKENQKNLEWDNWKPTKDIT